MSDTSSEASALDHAYFQELEAEFIRLRGAPLLLSPADWQVAKEWRGRGIPLELVVRVMERIFERQGGSDKRAHIRGLRYFRKAVEGAWRRIQELGGGDVGSPDAEPIDVSARLARLAAVLPSAATLREKAVTGTDPLGEALARAIEGVAETILSLSGDARSVERELQRIDHSFMVRLCESLDAETLESLRESVQGRLTALSERMEDETRDQTLELLLRRRLRQELGLPVLSLFSPESRASLTEV